jgi:DNA-binding MurR/RpiR family transcriptional regulator
MSEASSVPTSAEELRAAILERYDGLSKRLQQIARYVLDEPNELALETLAVIAERSGVQPSAIVRFAKSFGFDGASQMQRLFRDGLLSEFVEGNTIALQNLPQTVSDADLTAAVKLLEAADTVFVVGVRRAFPITAYLAYSLQQAGKRTIFVDGVAGLARQQVAMVTPKDLLIAVSYHPYADETVQAVEAAASRGAPVLSISDSLVSPIAKPATVTLQVRESEIRAFRSLSASMCLAQALVIGFAFESSRKEDARARRRKA